LVTPNYYCDGIAETLPGVDIPDVAGFDVSSLTPPQAAKKQKLVIIKIERIYYTSKYILI